MAESGNERKENSHSFKTVLTSGITVDVYCADITKIRCDVIVNSANERLWHAGGLSQIIENAAGPSLQKESDDYVSRKGELRESEVAVTGSGRLPCKAIIHAVGPTWSGEKHRDRCKESLYKTFLNSLLCADQRLQAKSVAVPPISHGYSVPIEVVSESILDALITYNESVSKKSRLKEIHIVDSSRQNIDTIAQYLEDHLT